jgi:hypothetical protein
MRCERSNCPERATHLVHIWYPDAPAEIWLVCRAHDRGLKLAFPRGRPQPKQIEAPPSSPRVHCRQCDQPLDEAVADVQDEGPHPCPYCGSLKRHIRVRLDDFGMAHESWRVRSKKPQKSGWLKSGESAELMLFARLNAEPLKYFVYQSSDGQISNVHTPVDEVKFHDTRRFVVRIDYSYGHQKLEFDTSVRRGYDGRLSHEIKGSGTSSF